MEVLKRLAELESKMKQLTEPAVNEAELDDKEMHHSHDNIDEPVDFNGKLSPELLERVYDGILTILGEMELEGHLPPMDNAHKIQEALLAIVRQLYIRKSMISKMGRKFARFGAKRFLRKQRGTIGRSISHPPTSN